MKGNTLIKLGMVAILGSIAGYFMFPIGLEHGLKSQINLAKNGQVFPLWSNPPFLTDSSFYLFEIENPRQALLGEKAIVKRRGPYNFKVANLKNDAEFSEDDQQVSLISVRKFFFNENGSARLDDKFYTVNPIIPTTLSIVKTLVMSRLPFERVASPLVYNAVNAVLDSHKERLFQKKTPRDLLYGYKVEIFINVQNVADRFGLGSLVPEGPPENTFGLAHFQNVTEEPFRLYTGVGKNPDRFGDVITWRGQSKMNKWKGQCNKISGTNGELQKPFPKPDKPIKVFLAQMCRSLQLDPVGKVMTTHGIEAIEYELTGKLFQGVRNNAANECYCSDLSTPDCQYDGLVSLGPCLFNAPAFISKPNFEDSDPRLGQTVEGFTAGEYPNKMSFYLDPITGSTVEADLAIMASFKVPKHQYFRDLGKVQNVSYIPLFMAHEKIILPAQYVWPLGVLQGLKNNYGLMFAIYAAAGGAVAFYGRRKASKEKKSGDSEDIKDEKLDTKKTGGEEDYNNKRKELQVSSGNSIEKIKEPSIISTATKSTNAVSSNNMEMESEAKLGLGSVSRQLSASTSVN